MRWQDQRVSGSTTRPVEYLEHSSEGIYGIAGGHLLINGGFGREAQEGRPSGTLTPSEIFLSRGKFDEAGSGSESPTWSWTLKAREQTVSRFCLLYKEWMVFTI